jgi:Quinolinate synthase
MAEQAAALNPDKKVLSPEPRAGCTLSDSLSVDELRRYREMYPNAPVVLYVNTSASVKALADYVVTSSTAVKVIKKIPNDTVIFGPDLNLANYVQLLIGNSKRIIKVPQNGRCIVHSGYNIDMVKAARMRHPNALLMAHPESPIEVLKQADFVGSTNQMIEYAKSSGAKEFIVATEIGMLNSLRIKVPGKVFYPLVNLDEYGYARCPYMAMVTLDKVYRSLRDEVHEVKLPKSIADAVKDAFERTIKLLEGGVA